MSFQFQNPFSTVTLSVTGSLGLTDHANGIPAPNITPAKTRIVLGYPTCFSNALIRRGRINPPHPPPAPITPNANPLLLSNHCSAKTNSGQNATLPKIRVYSQSKSHMPFVKESILPLTPCSTPCVNTSCVVVVQNELAMLDTIQPRRPTVAIQRAHVGFRRARYRTRGRNMRMRDWFRTPITAAKEEEEDWELEAKGACVV